MVTADDLRHYNWFETWVGGPLVAFFVFCGLAMVAVPVLVVVVLAIAAIAKGIGFLLFL